MKDLLIATVCFLGFILGIIISRYTKEEFKKGKPYLIILEIVILLALGIVLFHFFNWIYFLAGMLIAYFFRRAYLYFGIGLALSQGLLIPALIFIFGLPSGTINKKGILINLILFLVPFLILKFYPYNILSFSSGAFFSLAIFLLKDLIKK